MMAAKDTMAMAMAMTMTMAMAMAMTMAVMTTKAAPAGVAGVTPLCDRRCVAEEETRKGIIIIIMIEEAEMRRKTLLQQPPRTTPELWRCHPPLPTSMTKNYDGQLITIFILTMLLMKGQQEKEEHRGIILPK